MQATKSLSAANRTRPSAPFAPGDGTSKVSGAGIGQQQDDRQGKASKGWRKAVATLASALVCAGARHLAAHAGRKAGSPPATAASQAAICSTSEPSRQSPPSLTLPPPPSMPMLTQPQAASSSQVPQPALPPPSARPLSFSALKPPKSGAATSYAPAAPVGVPRWPSDGQQSLHAASASATSPTYASQPSGSRTQAFAWDASVGGSRASGRAASAKGQYDFDPLATGELSFDLSLTCD
jgi:hypothetical protein